MLNTNTNIITSLVPEVDRTVPYRIRVERRKLDLIDRLLAQADEYEAAGDYDRESFFLDLAAEARRDLAAFLGDF